MSARRRSLGVGSDEACDPGSAGHVVQLAQEGRTDHVLVLTGNASLNDLPGSALGVMSAETSTFGSRTTLTYEAFRRSALTARSSSCAKAIASSSSRATPALSLSSGHIVHQGGEITDQHLPQGSFVELALWDARPHGDGPRCIGQACLDFDGHRSARHDSILPGVRLLTVGPLRPIGHGHHKPELSSTGEMILPRSKLMIRGTPGPRHRPGLCPTDASSASWWRCWSARAASGRRGCVSLDATGSWRSCDASDAGSVYR